MAIALRVMMCYDVLEGVGQWHGNLVLFETSPCLAIQAYIKPWTIILDKDKLDGMCGDCAYRQFKLQKKWRY